MFTDFNLMVLAKFLARVVSVLSLGHVTKMASSDWTMRCVCKQMAMCFLLWTSYSANLTHSFEVFFQFKFMRDIAWTKIIYLLFNFFLNVRCKNYSVQAQ